MRIIKSLLVLCLSCLFFFLSPVYPQQSAQFYQTEFEKSIIAAFNKEDSSRITTLLQENRLLVKPLVDDMLNEGLRLALQNKKREANRKIERASVLAHRFEKIFAEKSLVIAVNYIPLWSIDQKKKKLLADSLYAVGTTMRGNKQQRDQALDFYLQALDIYTEIGDKRGEGTTLGGLGFIYWYKRVPKQALSYFRKALDIRQEVDDKQLIGNSLSDIGSLHYVFFRDYNQALQYWQRAEKIRKEIEDNVKLGQTISRIAMVYERLGQLGDALQYNDKAFRLHQKTGNESGMANALHGSGIILKDMGDYTKALDHLKRAYQIRKKSDDKKGIARTLNQMGIVYRRLGEFESALKNYEQVVQLAEQIGDKEVKASTLSNIGVILRNLQRPESAAEYYQKSLTIFQALEDQTGIMNVLSNLGLAYFDLKNYTESQKYLGKALALSRVLKDRTGEVTNLINLGNLQNYMGNLDQGLENYHQALRIAKAMNNPGLIWPAQLSMGDNYERRGEYEKAMDCYKQALETVESLRGTLFSAQYKASFMSQKRFAYEAVIHLLGELYESDPNKGYDLQAFRYAERAKARAFLDLLTESLAKVREGASQSLLQEQEKVLTEITTLQTQLQHESSQDKKDLAKIAELEQGINRLEEKYSELKNQIRTQNPRYYDLQYPDVVPLEDVQSSILEKDMVLLVYSVGDSSSALWAVTQDDKQFYMLPNRETLKNQVETVRFSLLNPTSSKIKFFAQSSHKLYEILIQPAEKLISKGNRLLVVPDGILHYLPFEILLTRNSEVKEGDSYGMLSYLIKSNPVNYVQSASVMNSLIQDRKEKNKIFDKEFLAFGDPVFAETSKETLEQDRAIAGEKANQTRGKLSRLKYSGEEIRKIAKLFPSEKAAIHLRSEATEDKLKEICGMSNCRYLHIASHGIVNERKPDFSSIALSQDKELEEDGFLLAAEIFNLNLHSDLVVLSACQTGLGKMVRGEGMIGLTRAFMYAGTPSVLVSLWSVSDISTSKLMENFYENMIEEGHGKITALHKAKLRLMSEQKFSHPFYWAPFIIIGDWR